MIYETIYSELRKTTKTRYAIARETGVGEPTLHKIYHRQQKHIKNDVADTLLKYFGYEITKRKDGE